MTLTNLAVIAALISNTLACNPKDSMLDSDAKSAGNDTAHTDAKSSEQSGDNQNDEANGPQGSLAIKGSLGDGFAVGADNVDATRVDKIISLPLQNGAFSGGAGTEAELSTTGAFAIDFNATATNQMQLDSHGHAPSHGGRSQSVIILIDETKSDPLDRVVGFIGLGAGASASRDSLIQLPLDTLRGDITELELGEVVRGANGQDASAPGALDAAKDKFTLSQSVLEETAKVDDVVRHAKNIYANRNADGVYYTASPFYIIGYDSNAGLDAWTDPAGVARGGFGIYFSTNDPAATFAKVCANHTSPQHALVEIFPPDIVQSGSATYSPSAPMTNSGTTGPQPSDGREECGFDTFYASGVSTDDNQGTGFNVGGGGFVTAMPSGKWMVKVEGRHVASFDLAAARPLDDQGKPKVYVPAIRLIANADHEIDAVELKWFRYDRLSGSYAAVTDLAAFARNINQFTLNFTDFSGTTATGGARIEGFLSNGQPASTGIYTFNAAAMQNMAGGTHGQKFLLPNQPSTTRAVAGSISIGYRLSGIFFMFTFNWL